MKKDDIVWYTDSLGNKTTCGPTHHNACGCREAKFREMEAELEERREDDKQWDKHSLRQIVEERNALKAELGALREVEKVIKILTDIIKGGCPLGWSRGEYIDEVSNWEKNLCDAMDVIDDKVEHLDEVRGKK